MHRASDFQAVEKQTKSQDIFVSLLGCLLVLVFIVTGYLSVRKLSDTSDEERHYRYGEHILAGNSNRFDDSKMPVSALNALPARLANSLPDGDLKTLLKKFVVARMMTVLFSAGVAVIVFSWARKLYGVFGGLAALALYVFDPNIIAHSQLVTTDLYATGTILFATYGLWKFAHERTWSNGLLCAFFLGLSLIAKYTSVVLLPLFILTLAIYDWPQGRAAFGRYISRLIGYFIVAILTSLLVINIGFLFNRSFTTLGDYHFQSNTFKQAIGLTPVLAKLRSPVPYPYLEGLDLVLMREQSGFGYGRIYFLGQLSENQGFPGYYFVAFLLKEPISTQLILLIALVVYFLNKRYTNFRQDELFLFIPTAFFVIYFNFFYNTQIGIRFYLVISPLLYVFAGSLFRDWQSFSAQQKAASYALFAYLLVSTFSYYPTFIPYFNEFIWDRKTAYKYLADSNIDWEQGQNYLQEYLAANPDVGFEPEKVKPGKWAISVNALVGVTDDPQKYAWLRENFLPQDSIANEYLVYRIPAQEFDAKCVETGFCK